MGEDAHWDGNNNPSLIGADEAGQTRRVLIGSGGNLSVRIRGNVKGFARIDASSEALNTVPNQHSKIHDGASFYAYAYDLDLDINETITLAFKTPDTSMWSHMFVEAAGQARGRVELYEAPAWSTSTGTQSSVYNRNRNSNEATTVLEDTSGTFSETNNLVLNPTGLTTGAGTIIDRQQFGDGKNAGIRRDEDEFILKQNTTYAIVITSEVVNSNDELQLSWYENISKN